MLGLLLLFVSGLAIRRAVLNVQLANYDGTMPFTLESALEYRVIKMLFESGNLPDHDIAIQVPEGVSLRKTYMIGAEWVYAVLAKWFPQTWSLPYRIRWISAGWFCLGIPLLALWLWWWLRSFWAACIGGGYYAVSLASVMRSTGQELSHENFALPLLIGHLALNALADSRSRMDVSSLNRRELPGPGEQLQTERLFWPAALLSAVFLGCAVSTWDLIQFYVLLWAAFGFFRFVAGRYFQEPRRRVMWLLCLLALVAAGVINPYLRAHSFLTSYAMLLAYGIGLGIILIKTRNSERGTRNSEIRYPSQRTGRKLARRSYLSEDGSQIFTKVVKLALALTPLVLGVLFFKAYEETYGHFFELLLAKLRFLNWKPSDPALLTFNQRILWTPALNSVNIQLTGMMFPVMIPLLFLTLLIILFDAHWRSDPGIIQLLVYGSVSLFSFILFMRFHVFLVIFGAALLGWAGCWATTRRNLIRWIVIGLLLFGISVEAAHVLDSPARWGRNLPYLHQQQELVRWMRDYTQGEPVLANFGISAFLLTYGGCSIVLHPKFESPEIRNRVREYGEALFHSNEAQFREWAEQYGANYYVYSLGEFSDVHPELQMRYFVDALHPPPDAAARLFEWNPTKLRYFTYLWGNSKYRVFRIISRSDERFAARYADEAQAALSHGDLDGAENKASLSLMYNPYDENAAKVLLHVSSLREKGVK